MIETRATLTISDATVFIPRVHTHTHTYLYKYVYIIIGLECRVFANGPEDLGSIPGRVIPKTLKIILDTSLDNTKQHKVRIKGKVEQSRARNKHLPSICVYAVLSYIYVLSILIIPPDLYIQHKYNKLYIYIYIYYPSKMCFNIFPLFQWGFLQ